MECVADGKKFSNKGTSGDNLIMQVARAAEAFRAAAYSLRRCEEGATPILALYDQLGGTSWDGPSDGQVRIRGCAFVCVSGSAV